MVKERRFRMYKVLSSSTRGKNNNKTKTQTTTKKQNKTESREKFILHLYFNIAYITI